MNDPKYIYYRKPIGTFDKGPALRLKHGFKSMYGRKVRVILRGRGKRVITMDDGTVMRFSRDLPLKFAEQYAIYLTLRK